MLRVLKGPSQRDASFEHPEHMFKSLTKHPLLPIFLVAARSQALWDRGLRSSLWTMSLENLFLCVCVGGDLVLPEISWLSCRD